MRALTCSVAAVVATWLLGSGLARATVLSFDFFDDAAKTTRTGSTITVPTHYGSNVSDSDPAGPIANSTFYATYGAAGGLTPDITVRHLWAGMSDVTQRGEPGAYYWWTGYGDLQYVGFPGYEYPWLWEIEFTPAEGHSVTLMSLDAAGWASDQTGVTLKAFSDYGSADPLWDAAPDYGLTVPASGHLHFDPMVTVSYPGVLRLWYAKSDGIALDNIVFAQDLPGPATISLLALGGIALLRRRN